MTDGGQPADAVAQRIAGFLDGAVKTLDIAIYDLRLDAGASAAVFGSFEAALKRGVTVRLMFNQDHPATIPDPPPPEVDYDFIDKLKAIGVAVKSVEGVPDLMHHKYVVRDAASTQAAVLTGSTNWTNDSFTREENIMFTIASAMVARDYENYFAELNQTGRKSSPADLCGCNFSLPLAALREVGGFNESYCFQRNDFELAVRLLRCRYEIRFCRAARANQHIAVTANMIIGRTAARAKND